MLLRSGADAAEQREGGLTAFQSAAFKGKVDAALVALQDSARRQIL
jgi:hypothetical protein